MKKVLIAILMIIIIALGVCVYNLYTQVNAQASEKEALESQIAEQNNQISDLQSTINGIKETIEEQADDEKTNTTEDVAFDADKMKLATDNCEYMEKEKASEMNFGIELTVDNGNVYITTDTSAGAYEEVFKSSKSLDKKEITGFQNDVIDAYVSYFGNGIAAPTLVFLMDDGTVQYVDSTKVIDDEVYESEGKLDDLSNIVKFVDVNVHENDGGGYMSVVAIDKDGYGYDLNEILD